MANETPPTEPLVEVLAEVLAQLGQGYAWHLDGRPRWQSVLQGVRRAVAEDPHLPGTSPLTPEGAVVFAGRLSDTLHEGARILLLDTDAHVADALIGLGHDVTAWVPAAALPRWQPAKARLPALVVVPRGVHEAIASDERRAFDAAVVDVAPHPQQWALRLSLAAAAIHVGGRLAVALHPQQREHGREQIGRLPTSRPLRHDESCARLIATAGTLGPRLALADALADQWILEVEDGPLPVDASAPRSPAALDEHEPTYARHGVCEIHDVRADVDAEALERALALAVARAGMEIAGGHGHVREGYVHRFIALTGGGHIAATLDRAAGLLNCGGWRWTPTLEAAVASACLDELPRIDAPVVLPRAS